MRAALAARCGTEPRADVRFRRVAVTGWGASTDRKYLGAACKRARRPLYFWWEPAGETPALLGDHGCQEL